MLKTVWDGPSLVVCNTCRHSSKSAEDGEGVRGGARLFSTLRTMAAADQRLRSLEIQEMACLFSCKSHCSVYLRAPAKVGYVLGGFSPTEDAARAILDYTAHYLESECGSVAYELWPEGVKGHFIVRTPPAGMLAE